MRGLALAALLLMAACGAGPGGHAALSLPDLKFAVIDSVGRPIFCDPDSYPVGRPEEPNAIKLYPQIRADESLYAAIVRHEHLPPANFGDLDDAQKLILYRAYKLLNAIELNASGGDYTFKYTIHTDRYELVDGVVGTDGAISVTGRSPGGPPTARSVWRPPHSSPRQPAMWL
jgi:hypothetical protein